MAFMSLVFMGIFLVLMIIGIIELLIAFIIFLTRFIKKKRNARVGKVSKIAAIILLILGILSEIPFALVNINYEFERINDAREYSKLQNKYQIGTEFLEDEFVYQGNTLVYVEEVADETLFGDPKMTLEANIIFKNSDKDYSYSQLYKAESESPYEIYRIYSSAETYVKKEDREKVIDFYLNKASYHVSITCKHSNVIEQYYDISRPKITEIISKGKKETIHSSSVMDTYCFDIISKDGLCGIAYDFVLLEDGNILYQTDKSGKKIEGILLSDEGAAYIKERIALIE